MFKEILKEEAGIADSVNTMLEKIKFIISNDYKQNGVLNYTLNNEPYSDVYHNTEIIIFENTPINLEYFILNNPLSEEEQIYRRNFSCKTNADNSKITLYLGAKDKKIQWFKYSGVVQHELEHLYQAIKQNKSFLHGKDINKYRKYITYMHSDNYYLMIIGLVNYYAFKFEKNAFNNEIYRELLDNCKDNIQVNPYNMLKNNIHYQNINDIKELLSNEMQLKMIKLVCKIQKIDANKFISIAHRVVKDYIKLFGRIIYKVNKDIEKLNEHTLVHPGYFLLKSYKP